GLFRGLPRRARDDEVEHLLPRGREVAQLVIDAENDLAIRCVAAHERALLQEVEQDRPTCHLAVMVRTGVVLPRRLRRTAWVRHGQARDDDVRPVHSVIPTTLCPPLLPRRQVVCGYTNSGSARTVDK